MILQEHIVGAFQSIINNKLRSSLSMLGIVIGVFSIIVMLAIGQGTSSQIMNRVSSMGANLISVTPGASNSSNVRGTPGATSSSKLLDEDFLLFTKNISGVKTVSPIASASKQFIYKTYNTNTQILGVTPVYQRLKNITLSNGRFIEEDDINTLSDSIVLGATIASSAFENEDPIGKEIRLQNKIFTVIGVLAENSQLNSRVILPISTVQSRISGNSYYSSLDIEVENSDEVIVMKSFVEAELRRYLGLQPEDIAQFTVSTMSELLASIQELSATMSLFLGGIAAISLLVGGIGVMNIMLVSVTERTREIGIRKAIGATSGDILLQFLIESIILSLFAGVLGIAGSFGIVEILNKFMTAVISTQSVIIAFSSVVFIGIFFGILPASKAAKLKPIDALRYE